jgi:propionyl-CoA synthetase
MEEVVAAHPAVAECAVVGVNDVLKGQIPVGFVVLKANVHIDPDDVQRELVGMVRDQVGPIASFKRVIVTKRLPKTRSGKILRRVMRSIFDGEVVRTPSTIEEPAVLEELAATLRAHQIGSNTAT